MYRLFLRISIPSSQHQKQFTVPPSLPLVIIWEIKLHMTDRLLVVLWATRFLHYGKHTSLTVPTDPVVHYGQLHSQLSLLFTPYHGRQAQLVSAILTDHVYLQFASHLTFGTVCSCFAFVIHALPNYRFSPDSFWIQSSGCVI